MGSYRTSFHCLPSVTTAAAAAFRAQDTAHPVPTHRFAYAFSRCRATTRQHRLGSPHCAIFCTRTRYQFWFVSPAFACHATRFAACTHHSYLPALRAQLCAFLALSFSFFGSPPACTRPAVDACYTSAPPPATVAFAFTAFCTFLATFVFLFHRLCWTDKSYQHRGLLSSLRSPFTYAGFHACCTLQQASRGFLRSSLPAFHHSSPPAFAFSVWDWTPRRFVIVYCGSLRVALLALSRAPILTAVCGHTHHALSTHTWVCNIRAEHTFACVYAVLLPHAHFHHFRATFVSCLWFAGPHCARVCLYGSYPTRPAPFRATWTPFYRYTAHVQTVSRFAPPHLRDTTVYNVHRLLTVHADTYTTRTATAPALRRAPRTHHLPRTAIFTRIYRAHI